MIWLLCFLIKWYYIMHNEKINCFSKLAVSYPCIQWLPLLFSNLGDTGCVCCLFDAGRIFNFTINKCFELDKKCNNISFKKPLNMTGLLSYCHPEQLSVCPRFIMIVTKNNYARSRIVVYLSILLDLIR